MGVSQMQCVGSKEARYLVPILKPNPLHASAELIIRRTPLLFLRLQKLGRGRGMPSSFNGTRSVGSVMARAPVHGCTTDQRENLLGPTIGQHIKGYRFSLIFMHR